MTNHQDELRKIDDAIQAQEKLRELGVLTASQIDDAIAALKQRQSELLRLIETGGGAYIEGDVNTQGGDFVNRDQVKAGDGGMAIGTIIINPTTGEPDYTPLREAYLNWVYDACTRLSLEGIDRKSASEAGTRLSLSAVYTALLTLTPEMEERRRKGGMMLEEGEVRRLSALSLLNQHKHMALLGDPGSGKSTFVSFVALCLAGEILGKPDANLQVLTEPLPADDEQRRSRDEKPERQPWDHGALLPVRVVLRDFAARGLPESGHQRAAASHLLDFIKSELQACGLGDYYPILHKTLLEQGGLLLLDGLDEVSRSDHRRRQIQQAVESFAAAHPKCRILVTCRTYAYQQQEWRLVDFDDAILAPFSGGQIERFIECWYQHIAVLRSMHTDEARGRAEMLKRAIFNSDRLLELAERPLLLTLMASLHAWRGGTLPEKRQQLYEETVDLLLDSWERPKAAPGPDGKMEVIQPSLTEWLKAGKDPVRALLQELAFQAHASQPDLRGTADIREADLITKLLALSRNPQINANPTLLVDYLSERAGLLVQRGHQIYTFPHRSFQEYLAACYLTDHDYPELVARLARQSPERWREAALLAGAKAAGGAQSTVWDLAEALCWLEPGNEKAGDQDIWGAHLAGQILAESGNLQSLSDRNQKRLERTQKWLVNIIQGDELPALERVKAGDSLAVLGDPRFDPECWYLPREPMLGFVDVPAGVFVMGGDGREHPVELPAYYIARYPTTVAQYRAFVEESGYESASARSINGVANHPVMVVTWHDAKAYAKWLNGKLGDLAREKLAAATSEAEHRFWEALASGKLMIDLPSEAEWEKAARGTGGRRYPWGKQPDPNLANYDETGVGHTSTVGCFPGGVTPYGVLDMAGNVYEWTRSIYKEYPYEGGDGREDQSSNDRRVVRGGSWAFDNGDVRCADRYWDDPGSRHGSMGFRVGALSPRK